MSSGPGNGLFNMTKVIAGITTSIDGYIAGPNCEADWIVIDPEIDFAAMAREYDALLMGRRTFQTTMGTGGGGGPFGEMTVVVASRTLDPDEHPGITVLSPPVEDAVTTLKQEPGKDIWLFGGGDLCRSLLAADLVDTIEVAVIPVVLGDGIPLVSPPTGRASLALTAHRVYPTTGTVALSYTVVSVA